MDPVALCESHGDEVMRLQNGDGVQNQRSKTTDVRLVQMSLLFTDHTPRVPARPQDRGAQACKKRTVKCSPGELKLE